MSFWTKFLIAIGLKTKPKPTPPPVPVKPPVWTPDTTWIAMVRGTILAVYREDGRDVPSNAEIDVIYVRCRPKTAGGEGWTVVEIRAYVTALPRPKPLARKGIVRKEGRNSFADDDGVFDPLGHTLFWTLRGWKFERDRVKKNIDWILARKYDYIRILGQVDWAGNDIHPDWPDYEQVLTEVIDYIYAGGGRTQLTLMGGGGSFDMNRFLDTTIRVVNARPEKIMFLEVCNEAWQNFNGDLEGIGRRLVRETKNLVTCTAPAEELVNEVIDPWVAEGAATCGVGHFDRDDSTAEFKWRHVRKAWENRDPRVPSSHNEPGGPRSSVAQFEEAIHLVMSRAVGMLCKWNGWVLHNGSGVFGVPMDKYGGRTANVYETPAGFPDITGIADAIRGLDKLIPADLRNGTCTRKDLGPHPFAANAFVGVEGYGVVREYASVNDVGFWQTLIGIKDHVLMTPNAAYDLKFINPLTGAVMREESVVAGQTIRVEPMQAVDSRGFGAAIVLGRRR